MAETIRYDTSDDPVAAQQIAEAEAESLKVGEELMAKQDKMLAGKYKSAEDLETAYLELQKKLGNKETLEPAGEAEEAGTEVEPPQFYNEDKSVNYETANELYGEQLGNLFKDNSIDPFEMNEYFGQNNGTLNEEMYGKLEQAGLTKEVVDNYLAGVRNAANLDPVQPVLTEAEIAEVKSVANGEEGYQNLMDWAGQNLNKQAIEEYDSVLKTANKTAIKFAVSALMGKYEDSQGRDSKIVTGKEAPTENYRSMAEVVRDMNKPEYQNDQAFRDDVIRKLAASNLKV